VVKNRGFAAKPHSEALLKSIKGSQFFFALFLVRAPVADLWLVDATLADPAATPCQR